MRKSIRIAATIAAFLAAFLFYKSNFTGYCAETGRHYTSEDYIRRAAEYLVRAQSAAPKEYMRYSSVDEFLRSNTNCCVVGFYTGAEMGDSFGERLERLFGHFKVSVQVQYRIKRCGTEQFAQQTVLVSSCGETRIGEQWGPINGLYEYRASDGAKPNAEPC